MRPEAEKRTVPHWDKGRVWEEEEEEGKGQGKGGERRMKGRGKGVEGRGERGEEVGNGRNRMSGGLISQGKLDSRGHITGGNQSTLQGPKSGAGTGASVAQSRTPKGSSELCPSPVLPASIPPLSA